MTVPVAVSALSQEDIERYGSSSVSRLAEVTPSLILGKSAGASGFGMSIRGVGTDGSNVGFDQSVSVNVDGVQMSRGRALISSYFDLRQVEILKGPQALFFGKNSPAGVVSLTSRDPGTEFEAYARFSYETEADEMIGEAALSGPISDAFGARLAVRGRTMDGYMRNFAVPQTNPAPFVPNLPGATRRRLGEEEYNARLTLTYDADGPLTAKLKVAGTHYEDDGQVMNMELVHCASGPDTVVTQTILGRTLVDPVGECRPNWNIASTDIPPEVAANYLNGRDGRQYSEMDAVISSLTLAYATDAYSVTAVTGYFYHDTPYLMNNDWSSYATISATEHETFRSISQELRLLTSFDSRVNFMIGGFFEDTDLDFERSMNLDSLPADPATGRYQWTNHRAGIEGQTFSAFGQIIWSLSDSLEFTAGARWTEEEKDSFLGNEYSHPLVAAVFPLRTLSGGALDFKDTNVSPEATLTWRMTDDFTIYGAYKTGYKSGGAGISAVVQATTTERQVVYDPEEAEGFEIGAKGDLLDGRLRTTTTVYRYVFDDLQVNSWDPITSSYFTTNAAEVRQYGIEEEISWLATDQLSIRASAAYNHSEYESFPSAQCYSGQTIAQGCIGGAFQDLSGRPTQAAPEWVVLFGATYVQPIAGAYELEFAADGFYSDEYYYIPTQSPFAIQSSFVRWNASVRLRAPDGRWELGVVGRNLSNEKVLVSGQDRPAGVGDLNGVLSRPRELTVLFNYNF
jgi:outer membrane receptor protein involved in Fe transport